MYVQVQWTPCWAALCTKGPMLGSPLPQRQAAHMHNCQNLSPGPRFFLSHSPMCS